MLFSRQTIQNFFASNREKGADLNRAMRWGFFFVDVRRKALVALVPLLKERGLRYVDILEPAPENDTPEFFLHFEKDERHSVASLHRCCVELHELAEREGTTYDGFDVGNIDGSVLY
jgi:hypothetical protein